MKPGSKKYRSFVIYLVVFVATLFAITVAFRWHRLFPSDEVSQQYARFADVKGLDVSFVKKYRVNDSLIVDVTLIEANDSVEWDFVCEELGILPASKIPDEYKAMFFSDCSFEHKSIIDSTSSDEAGYPLRDVYVYSRKRMEMCIFHSLSQKQYDLLVSSETEKITNNYYQNK